MSLDPKGLTWNQNLCITIKTHYLQNNITVKKAFRVLPLVIVFYGKATVLPYHLPSDITAFLQAQVVSALLRYD